MPWLPADDLRALLQKVLTRAKETALVDFADKRKRIENEQAARGVMGGMVAHRCIEEAGTSIKSFANAAVSDLLETVAQGKALSRDCVQSIRETVNAQIDGLMRGLGTQIDDLKTTGGLKGNAARLERFGLEAKRDADIKLSHVELDLPKPALRPIGPMYHLLVAGSEHTWSGSPATFERDRIFEFTDDEVRTRFSSLDAEAVAALLALPAVFAYEQWLSQAPLFGRLVAIVPRPRDVRVEYEIAPVTPFLAADDIEKYGGELGIAHRFERYRTHWAVKAVNLPQVLARRGITLPPMSRRPRIDIETHHFEVALSFPGEKRDLVRPIADGLEHLLGQNTVFYDDFFPGELAQLGLDTLLQSIYGKRSRVVVVVAGADYQRKDWCGLEFRAIKDRIMARENRKVMIVRTDDGDVDGIFKTDGYLDARRFDTTALAGMIAGRVEELRSKQ